MIITVPDENEDENLLSSGGMNMKAWLELICVGNIVCFICQSLADKYSYYDTTVGERYSDSISHTLAEKSALLCTMRCLASAQCMGCNWEEATGTCQLVAAHTTTEVVSGYTMYTRKYRKTISPYSKPRNKHQYVHVASSHSPIIQQIEYQRQ